MFLQVAAGLVLLRSRDEDALALRIFGALFLLNAGASAIMVLPREYAIWLAADRGVLTRAFRALDAPTGALLLAFLAARSAMPRRELAVRALVVAGILGALAEFPFHATIVRHEWLIRALPLYVGLGAAAYVCAGGRGWERWIALALVARALYWSTTGVIAVIREGFGDEANVYVNRIGLLALGAVALAASARLLRSADGPSRSIAAPVLLIGPACALLETAIALSLPPEHTFRYGSVVLVNLVTLGLVRPIVTLAGVAPEALVPATARATLASGIAAVGALVARFDLPDTRATALDIATGRAASFGVGLLLGLLALAVVWASPGLAFRSAPPTPAPPPAGPAIDRSRPQWQTLLLELRGSSRLAGPPPRSLTQRLLAQRTGLRVARISGLVRETNELARSRLETHLPAWRGGAREPALIEQFRGRVEGMPGVWVYYRLTPEGELLAESLAPVADSPAPRG